MQKAAIGIDIGGTNVKLGVVNSKGKVLLRDGFPTHSARSRAALLSALVVSIERLKKMSRARGNAG